MSLEKIVIGIIAALFQSIAVSKTLLSQVNLSKMIINKIKLYISVFIYCILGYFFVPNELRFLSFLVGISIILYFVMNIKECEVILYSFNTEILLVVSEIIGALVLVLLGINSVSIVKDPIYNLIANVIISLILLLIICIPIVKGCLKNLITLYKRNKKIINYVAVFALLCYIILSKNGLEFILKSNYYINILFIIGIILIITIFIKNELKSEKLKEQNQQMLNYVTKYEKIITEQGKTNHEFKNQLMVIKGYAQLNSKKLMEYLDSITKDFNKTTSSYLISQLNKFPDGGIKGLLYYKLSIMDDEKINFEIDVESGVKTKLKKLEIETYKNITKVLGVLLDNAIDASKKSKEKNVVILVTKDNKEVIFSISNTYKGKIEIEKIGTGYTTKGKGHGYGLRLVNDIIERQKELKVENCLDNGYYTTKLIINTYNKKDN